MIKFIDVKNGQIFDGSSYVKKSTCPICGYSVDKNYYDKLDDVCPMYFDKPCKGKLQHTLSGPHYIFWYDGGQSTGIYHVKEICILTDNKHGRIHPTTKKHVLNVTISNNDIFNLVNINNLNIKESVLHEDVINGFEYVNIDNLINSKSIFIEGEKYGDYYIHMLYIIAKSDVAGEFTQDINIDGIPYTIGADFYVENESLYVNLSNLGFDISSDIQKALYPSNVHEDYPDNILINRKLKELLINFWDVIANKGSHKSLINSLKWFEWGDITSVSEIWKHNIGNKFIYSGNNLETILTDKYKDCLSHFAKTTYIGLYTALETIKPTYDEENNPELEFISSKWSFNDLSLKMSMLGKFYEMFFMPIHLDLIHSTIEDIVFTNTIKIHQSMNINREDRICNFGTILHNVTEPIYYMQTITTSIPDNAITTIMWSDTSYDIIESNGDESSVYYTGVGVRIPVSMKIPVSNNGEFIKKVTITLNTGISEAGYDIWNTQTIYKHFKKIENGFINVDFDIICCKEFDYDIRFEFELTDCHIYTTNLNFKTSDIDNVIMNVYKYTKKDDLKPEDFGAVYIDIDNIENDFNAQSDLSRFSGELQYMSIAENSNIGLNHVIVLEGDYVNNSDTFFEHYYTILYINKDKKYTVCISKDFDFEPDRIPQFLLEVMYSNGYRYFSEFYDMKELSGNKIEDYTIGDNEALCISLSLKFGKQIKDYEWVFKNLSNGSLYYPQMNIYSPFVTHDITTMDAGFYDIIFTYELYDGTVKEFKLNSAFYKK